MVTRCISQLVSLYENVIGLRRCVLDNGRGTKAKTYLADSYAEA